MPFTTPWIKPIKAPKKPKKANWSLLNVKPPKTKAKANSGYAKYFTDKGVQWNPTTSKIEYSDPGKNPWQTPDYPGSYDMAGLLANLARNKDAAIAQLRGDLEGRAAAINKLYGEQTPIIQANYDKTSQEAAAVNDAVANRLQAEGTAAGGDLLAKLAAINAPGAATQAVSGDVAKYYAGAGGANYAKDAGDIERLLTRKSEELTLNAKQPAIIRQQLESQFGSDVADLMMQYMQDQQDIQSQGADFANTKAMWQYEQKQQHESDVAAQAQKEQDRLDALYTANEDRKSKERMLKWSLYSKAQQTKASLSWKAQDAADKRQHDIDMANLQFEIDGNDERRKAAIARAEGDYKQAHGQGTGGSKTSGSNVNTQRVSNAVINSIITTDSKGHRVLKSGINPSGYNSELSMQRQINAVLWSYGIDPNSKQGASMRKNAMGQAGGLKYSANPQAPAYKYDPNWAKKIKTKAKNKPKPPKKSPKKNK